MAIIRRLLIANRGEIALRIIRACRTMRIESVAVYSDADVRAPHVFAADYAVPIGPSPSTDSYLATSRVIDAARSTGADAVHPGYGFLAENPEFAAACHDASLVFVGPPADVLRRVGSKIDARRTMEASGVPVVPGFTPIDQSELSVSDAALSVGLPVLIKPSGGGGGKGMRLVSDAGALDEAIRSARREAVAAFGDGTLYVERVIPHPRHVEVQIMADEHGNVVHLFERDCSTQRRHQKVIEESPSPALTPELRRSMGDAAVRAATAAGYRNAGTIEFLLEGFGKDARFYFLEVNARLQVEHAVTEAVTGVDLVRAQILVASGCRLPWSQKELSQRGHAIECRIYAEDPSRDFVPQAGRLLVYEEPSVPGVRIDSGVIEGSEVSVYYDPLLAKLIAHGEARELALDRADAALRSFPILGIRTNIAYLLRILDHPRFRAGTIDTSFLDQEHDALLNDDGAPPAAVLAAAVHYEGSLEKVELLPERASGSQSRPATDPWSALEDWRN